MQPKIEFAKFTLALMAAGLVTREAQLWAAFRLDAAIFYNQNATQKSLESGKLP